MRPSMVLFFAIGYFVFAVVAAPAPSSDETFQVEKRQGDRQILSTIAPNYLVPLNQSHPDTVYGSQQVHTH